MATGLTFFLCSSKSDHMGRRRQAALSKCSASRAPVSPLSIVPSLIFQPIVPRRNTLKVAGASPTFHFQIPLNTWSEVKPNGLRKSAQSSRMLSSTLRVQSNCAIPRLQSFVIPLTVSRASASPSQASSNEIAVYGSRARYEFLLLLLML